MKVNIGVVSGDFIVRVSTELPDRLVWAVRSAIWNAVLYTNNAPAMVGKIIYILSKHTESVTVHNTLCYDDYVFVVHFDDKLVCDNKLGSYTFTDIETWCTP